jgi:hypothetical protein
VDAYVLVLIVGLAEPQPAINVMEFKSGLLCEATGRALLKTLGRTSKENTFVCIASATGLITEYVPRAFEQ